ncbi:hypothetical protein PPL_03717 [Heterostelium album PN500]|uniref:Uncharacterized protein n=1 Tax=Heterostelium pallidum (strain ATCC 26659 / Pp 5 / PN500) TaxID=670386 RepID=D3B6G9_HETP5|nr:hypothetical protein PPL_03717 [Heterostelium album PN500]EFA82939.1 hypothetical protein PPL_03717 [Heterostelium album PN500]|eukprot:XP_020435056.1 hypothetical protein PPL_03717 [Heterostelium album PN500]
MANLQPAVIIEPTIVDGEGKGVQILNTTNRVVRFLIRSREAHEEFPDHIEKKAQHGTVGGNNTAKTYMVHSDESFVSVFIVENGRYLIILKNRQVNRGKCIRIKQSHIIDAEENSLPVYYNEHFEVIQNNNNNGDHHRVNTGAEGA